MTVGELVAKLEQLPKDYEINAEHRPESGGLWLGDLRLMKIENRVVTLQGSWARAKDWSDPASWRKQ